MWWRKKEPEVPQMVMAMLPGRCECGHIRSVHIEGIGHCAVDCTRLVTDKERARLSPGQYYFCACQIFIRDNSKGGDGVPEVPDDPEVVELKKMAGL
jgi:hypothetical protein